jgi:hypothetical protein
MPRLSRAAKNPADGFAPYEGVSPNQVVAYNLARVRAYRQMTQDQARQALAPYLGVEWSKANYSAAERSMDGVRVRQFDADEIVAFARAFRVPIAWFFMPPDPAAADGADIHLDVPDAKPGVGKPMGELIDLVYGDDEMAAMMSLILRRLIQGYGEGGKTDAQRRIEYLANARKWAIVKESFQYLHRGTTALRAIANQLEDLAIQAGTATLSELDVPEEWHRGQ